jgi:hypothetical protein
VRVSAIERPAYTADPALLFQVREDRIEVGLRELALCAQLIKAHDHIVVDLIEDVRFAAPRQLRQQ